MNRRHEFPRLGCKKPLHYTPPMPPLRVELRSGLFKRQPLCRLSYEGEWNGRTEPAGLEPGVVRVDNPVPHPSATTPKELTARAGFEPATS